MPKAKRKLCVRCGQEKSVGKFEPRYDRQGGYRNACRECLNFYRKERWRIRNAAKYEAQIEFQKKYPGQKKCNKCEKIKDIERFHKDSMATDGHKSVCKVCKNIYNQNHRKKHKGLLRKNNLKKFGITHDEYEKMLGSQGGKCMICGTSKPNKSDRVKHFSVDHCHKTKKIRALLCGHCNSGLGHFKDSSQLLRKAADYLELFK